MLIRENAQFLYHPQSVRLSNLILDAQKEKMARISPNSHHLKLGRCAFDTPCQLYLTQSFYHRPAFPHYQCSPFRTKQPWGGGHLSRPRTEASNSCSSSGPL